MGSEKKTLLFMYVDEFFGFYNVGFNFDIETRFLMNRFDSVKKSTRGAHAEGFIGGKHYQYDLSLSPENVLRFSPPFFGERISALTLLIGDNGSGKTTLMQLLAKWMCELYSGNYPKERGVLVIREGDSKNHLIAFQNGDAWRFKGMDKVGLESKMLEPTAIQNLLKDIELIYYTDTMTDLEMEELLTKQQLRYLTDYSLIKRLSEAANRPNYLANVKDTMKRSEFAFQMDFFLHSCDQEPFPIHYMKFSSVMIGESVCFDFLQSLGTDGSELVSLLKEYGQRIIPKEPNCPQELTRCLLWGIFTGAISSILLWEQRVFGAKPSVLVPRFWPALSQHITTLARYDDDVYGQLETFFENLTNLISDSDNKYFHGEFARQWKKILTNTVVQFITALHEAEEQYIAQNVVFHWQRRPATGRILYYIRLDALPKEHWTPLWTAYTQLYHMLPDCYFDWHYASSGERCLINCQLVLYHNKKNRPQKPNYWFLFDEPDNTVHPGRKRAFIENLYNECKKINKSNGYYQFLISTHSPIMLSDVPKQAAIYLSTGNEYGVKSLNRPDKKIQIVPQSSPFAQQIYTLFAEAFIMKQGAIGSFAEEKIRIVFHELSALESALNDRRRRKFPDAEHQLLCAKSLIDCLDEPLLRGYIQSVYNRCKSKFDKRKSASGKRTL